MTMTAGSTLVKRFSDVPPETVATLTRSLDKVSHYSTDPYFRHGIDRCRVSDALASTFVILKSDAIAGRRVPPVLDFLSDNEFQIVAATKFRFNPLLIREVWRYQFNTATRARVEVVDLLLLACDSLLLVLRDLRYSGGLPAACRLAGLKGAADPKTRGPGNLRSLLRGPTMLFNFVHTADEPADVVRELALLGLAIGESMLPALAWDQTVSDAELTGLVEKLHAEQAAHDLDATRSWQRLAAAGPPPVAELARRALAGDRQADWSALLDRFPCRTPPPELLWDVLSIATSQIEHSAPGLRPVLPTVGGRAWIGKCGGESG